jgi:hypothetical protein
VDTDGELLKLRDIPSLLRHVDFVESYGLEGTGVNPHRFKEDEIEEHLVNALFKRHCGKGGRVGYCWNDCKNLEVLARAKFLASYFVPTLCRCISFLSEDQVCSKNCIGAPKGKGGNGLSCIWPRNEQYLEVQD